MAMGEKRNWLRFMSRGRRKLFAMALVSRLVSSLGVIELILDIINIILIFISFNTRTPPVSSESSLALRATLSSIFPLVLIARPTHREGTFITRDKDISSFSESNIITTDLTYLAIHILQRFGPAIRFMSDPNELVSPVGSSNQAGTGLHRSHRHTEKERDSQNSKLGNS
jgi:hypothetical protein